MTLELSNWSSRAVRIHFAGAGRNVGLTLCELDASGLKSIPPHDALPAGFIACRSCVQRRELRAPGLQIASDRANRNRLCIEQGSFRYVLGSDVRDPIPPSAGGWIDGTLLWVLCNSSSAGAEVEDPTSRKVEGFTQRLGFTRWRIVNRHAYRTPYPRELRRAIKAGQDTVGPRNPALVKDQLQRASVVLFAWGGALPKPTGNDGFFTFVRTYFHGTIWCLGLTEDGEPRHPLMLSYDTQPTEFEGC
jgi:hypothetical protein